MKHEVIDEIVAERRRQIEDEGWTSEHDDRHLRGEMARAAVCYLFHYIGFSKDLFDALYQLLWPWAKEWWKPKNPRRDLIRAATLIVAEIELMDRRT